MRLVVSEQKARWLLLFSRMSAELSHIQRILVGVAVTIIAATLLGNFVLLWDMRVLIAEQGIELKGINSRLSSTVSVDVFSANQVAIHTRIGINSDDISDLWQSHGTLRKEVQDHEH